MNIKIPYSYLGRMDDLEFVTLLLAKGEECTYEHRMDRTTYPALFNHNHEFITIPNEVFKRSDLIIFCPYTKNKNWGKKIVFNKKSKEFARVNGGLEFIKNSSKVGNINSLKKWIKRGFEIPIIDKPIGEKNLIYFSAFGDPGYIDLARPLIRGLKNQPYKNFDLLFITDKKTKKSLEKLKELSEFNVHYLIKGKIEDAVEASMQKLKIYEFEKIDEYKKILFLDLDILVVGDLSKIFEERMNPNILYSATHRFSQNIHRTSYHTIQQYTDTHLEMLAKLNIFSFNAGQFLFLNTPTMKNHFKNVSEFIKKWKGKYFFEQSFMNTYFNTLRISNVFKFKDQFCFISINSEDRHNILNQDSVFVHYMGSVGNPKSKLEYLKKHYPYLLKNEK